MAYNRIGHTLFVSLPADCDAEVMLEVGRSVADDVFAHRDRKVVIDAGAIELIDAADAAALVDLCRTIRLLGASPVVAGLRAEVVAALIGLGVDLRGIECALDIASAVEGS